MATRTRRPAPDGARLARPGDPAGIHADGAGDDRARPDQLQPGHRLHLRLEADRPRAGSERDRQGLQDLHAAPGHVLRRGRDRALPVAVPAGSARRRGRLPPHGRRRAAPDRVPARSGQRLLGRIGRADRAPHLSARRVRSRSDAGRGRCPGRLRLRPHVQRDDADAEPRLLQPPVALGAHRGRAREPRPQRRARLGLLSLRHVGHPTLDDRRQHRRHGSAPRAAPTPPGADRAGGNGAGLRAHRAFFRSACRGATGLAWPPRGPRTVARRPDHLGRLRACRRRSSMRVMPAAGRPRAPRALSLRRRREPS